MAATMNYGVIIACAIAGGLVLVIVGTVGLILILRRRHRRKLLAMDHANAPRGVDIPGRNVSMTDADIESLPHARTMLRQSTRLPHSYPQPYAAIPSKESLPQYRDLRNSLDPPLAKASIPGVDHHQQSWPLPRRLTKSSTTVIPLAKFQRANISRSPKSDATLPRSKTALQSATQRDPPSGYLLSGKPCNTELKPKPLAITKKRSMSHGMLPTPSTAIDKGSGTNVLDSKEQGSQGDLTSRRQRSNSLYTRQPGMAPSEPVPPLPANILLKSVDRTSDSPGKRTSLKTARSRDTSVLHDGISKCLSQIETDLKSIGAASLTFEGSGISRRQENHSQSSGSGHITEAANPINASKQATPRPKVQTQHSYRASIQQHSPRSASKSSGLSISLLESPSRKACRLTLNLDDSPISKLRFLRELDKLTASLPTSPSPLPLSRNSMFRIHDENETKRASTTIQNAFSHSNFKSSDSEGSNISPAHGTASSRPLSIATSDPFQYEHRVSLKDSQTLPVRDGHAGSRCESCLRTSTSSIISSSSRRVQRTSEDTQALPSKPASQVSKPDTSLMRPLPPSHLIRNPTPSTPTPASRMSHLSIHPSSSFLNMHNPFPGSSPKSPLVTPTQHNSDLRTSASHPNRDKPIFDAPSTEIFSFSTPEQNSSPSFTSYSISKPDLHLDSATPSNHQQSQTPPPSTEDQLLKPEHLSTLFPFPSPPHEIKPNGPRSLPRSSRRSPSPSKNRINKLTSSNTWAPTNSPRRRDLKKIVSALRRENSDASKILKFERSDSYRKGHERYCSLGGEDDDGDRKSSIVADDVDKENEYFYGTETKRKGGVKAEKMWTGESPRTPFESLVKGPREMPSGSSVGKSRIPRMSMGGVLKVKGAGSDAERRGVLYDEGGFLRE